MCVLLLCWLVYMGTASDIVDFLTLLGEPVVVKGESGFVYATLAVWSWSLMQVRGDGVGGGGERGM